MALDLFTLIAVFLGAVLGWFARDMMGKRKGAELIGYIAELENKLEIPHRYQQSQTTFPNPFELHKEHQKETQKYYDTRLSELEEEIKNVNSQLKKIMKKLGI